MVEVNAGDDGQNGGFDDVRGVEPSAHADFEYDIIAVLPAVIFEGNRSDEFEFGGLVLHGIGKRADIFGHFGEVVVGNVLVVEHDALVEPFDKRRGVQTDAVAGILEDTGEHPAGGTLAVGAADVDEFQRILGMTEFFAKFGDAGQSGTASHPADGVDIFESFVVGHSVPDFLFYLITNFLSSRQRRRRTGTSTRFRGTRIAYSDRR